MSRCGTFRSGAQRARTLAGALAVVLAGASLYANNIRDQYESRSPNDSFGNITLACGAPVASTPFVIVWPSQREG